MAESKTEVIIGAAVIAVAAGFLFYATQATGVVSERNSYPLKASFRSANGIGIGTDVRLAGVKIGTVTAMDLNPETFRADITLAVRQGLAIPEDSAILVTQDGLLGGNYIEIIPGGSPFNLEPGAEIEDTQGSISLLQLLMKFGGGGSSDGAGNAK